jgi:hypothetical protein
VMPVAVDRSMRRHDAPEAGTSPITMRNRSAAGRSLCVESAANDSGHHGGADDLWTIGSRPAI